MQDRDVRPYATAPDEPRVAVAWPGRKPALGLASLFVVAALAALSFTPNSPARTLTLPRLVPPFGAPGALDGQGVERARTAATPAPPAAPAGLPSAAPAAVAAPVAAAEPAPAAPPARPAWQPPNAPHRPYTARVERWRPLVRQLLAEMWDEGRLDGAASRLDDDLVLALIQQESGGDPDAYSWAGAIGLMQVMDFTFADMMHGDKSLAGQIDLPVMFDVESNMRAGLRYLALAMNAHEGNFYWALASYNAGIEAVDDWRAAGLYAVPPIGGYDETANYAQVILRNYLRHRPDVQMYVPDPMPPEHVAGAVELLVKAGRW